MYDDRSRPRRVWLALGHYSSHISAVASLVGAVAVAVFTVVDVTVARHAVLTLVLAVYAVTLASITAERTHHRSLCPREISDAPVLDPQAAVDRHRRELLVWHSRHRRIASAIAGTVILVLYLLSVRETWLFVAGFGCSALISSYLTYVDITHRRLYPWCPHCRHGGRGPRGFRVPGPTDPAVPKPVPQT